MNNPPLAETAASPLRESTKLRLLRQLDSTRAWVSLEDERVCVLCRTEFRGRDIRVAVQNGRATCHCPTPGCRGELRHFVFVGNPLVDEETWRDWMMALDEEEPVDEASEQ